MKKTAKNILITIALIAQHASNAAMPKFTGHTSETDQKNCGISMSFPNWFNNEHTGCSGSPYNGQNNSSVFTLSYFKYNEHLNENFRTLSLGIYNKPIKEDLKTTNNILIADDQFNVTPNSNNAYLDCDKNKPSLKTTRIEGSNWQGWIIDETYLKPRKKFKDESCQKFTPNYRCTSMLIGNNKITMHLAGYCFLRKNADNLDEDLSFDVFMNMIKTLHFNEGVKELGDNFLQKQE